MGMGSTRDNLVSRPSVSSTTTDISGPPGKGCEVKRWNPAAVGTGTDVRRILSDTLEKRATRRTTWSHSHGTAQHSTVDQLNRTMSKVVKTRGGGQGGASRQGGSVEAMVLVICQRQIRRTGVGCSGFESAAYQPDSPGRQAYYIRQAHLRVKSKKRLGQACLSPALSSSPSCSCQEHFSSISSETFVARACSIKSSPRRAMAARA